MIAFTSDRYGDMVVYAMNADGSRERRVTGLHPGGFCCCLAWSPDGTQIALCATGKTEGGEREPTLFLDREKEAPHA